MKDVLGYEINPGDRLAIGGSGSGNLYFCAYVGPVQVGLYGGVQHQVLRESDGKMHTLTEWDIRKRAVNLTEVATPRPDGL